MKRATVYRQVRAALKRGDLVRQPCERGDPTIPRSCTPEQPVEAHHDDYDKPLEVRWLCKMHHHAHHQAMGAYKNNGRKKGEPWYLSEKGL